MSNATLSAREVDKCIKEAKPVTLYFAFYREEWTGVIVSRDRWTFTSADGKRFDRSDASLTKTY